MKLFSCPSVSPLSIPSKQASCLFRREEERKIRIGSTRLIRLEEEKGNCLGNGWKMTSYFKEGSPETWPSVSPAVSRGKQSQYHWKTIIISKIQATLAD